MKKKAISGVCIAVGVLLLYLGLTEGGFLATLHKAVFVCLECIGIG